MRTATSELAKKFDKVELAGDSGVSDTGNHDINNPKAAGYQGKDIYPANNTDPRNLRRFMASTATMRANSRDSNSLSSTLYLTRTPCSADWDTCQYEPSNRVGGMIKTETYEWIEQQLTTRRK